MLRMSDVDLKGKRVLIRDDLNVPMKNGVITSNARIQAALPGIKLAIKASARVILMSHLGRPTPGVFSEEFSLAAVATELSQELGQTVTLISDWLDKPFDVEPGQVILLENVRFNPGEKENSEELAKKMASFCDIFVMDAFATAHRAEASTMGIIDFAPIACAGPLLCREIDMLTKALHDPKRPLVAVVGGAKVSTKLTLLETLANKVDGLIIGGGIANTFLAAQGYDVGGSLYEPDLVDAAENIQQTMEKRGATLPMPQDAVVAEKMSADAEAFEETVNQVAEDEKIFDIGSDTTKAYIEVIKKAGTILWNGPLGAFEIDQFGSGTEAIAHAIAESKAFSIAGGGDTLVAIEKYGVANDISYISTGGGAFLAFVEAGTLPAVEALNKAEKRT
jgi:phosphoglycerate kinase